MFYDDDDLNSVKKLCIFRSDISSRCRLELPNNSRWDHLSSRQLFTKETGKKQQHDPTQKSFPDEDTVQFKCDCGLPSIEIAFLPAGGTRTFSKPAHWWHCQLTTRSVLTSSERIFVQKLKLLS
jgi:hypothetical protein